MIVWMIFWIIFGLFFVMNFGTNFRNNFTDNLFFHPFADQNLLNEDRAKHYLKNEWTLCKNPNFHSVICTGKSVSEALILESANP